MRRSAMFSIIILLLAGAGCACAQVEESADTHQFTITAGGFGSAFKPGSGIIPAGPQVDGGNVLVGLGTYVDFHFTHWFQVEGEARWLRFNEYGGEHEDNYLIGPKVPIHQFGRANVYGKVLIGVGKMTFPYNYGYGTFTDIAYGGGVDYKLSRKISLRAIDFEYQQWPVWIKNAGLYPYGASVGVGYRVF